MEKEEKKYNEKLIDVIYQELRYIKAIGKTRTKINLKQRARELAETLKSL